MRELSYKELGYREMEDKLREAQDLLYKERRKVAELRSTMHWMVDHVGGYERELAKNTLKETQ